MDTTFTITETNKKYLISFIEEVLVTCANDTEGITMDLYDLALNAGSILGLSKRYMEELE